MKELRPAILLFIIFTLLCGGLYSAVVAGVASVAFPKQAEGSLVADGSGRIVGSALIGQPFSGPQYFWPRPSAATDFGYNPGGSGGSNSGPTNPDYLKTVADRVKALRDAGVAGPIPAELVQASGSGLDPHISPQAAMVQISRVAKGRGMSEDAVRKLVEANTEPRQLGVFGVPQVNVLKLNLALDGKKL